MLDVLQQIHLDNDIESYEYHPYLPYNENNLSNNDMITITMQQNDILTDISNSYIYLHGIVQQGTTPTQIINNGLLHLFTEIRFNMNSVPVDIVRNPGMACTMKMLSTLSASEVNALENAGIVNPNKTDIASILNAESRKFNVCIPLKIIMGFFEDYRKAIINSKLELIFIRGGSDLACLYNGATASATATVLGSVKLDKIVWMIPHVRLSDAAKIPLYKMIERGTEIPIAFRSWELHEIPNLPLANRHSWHIKTSSQSQKPRYILFTFQNDKKDNLATNQSTFDFNSLRSLTVFLNNEKYPFNPVEMNKADEEGTAILYEQYKRLFSRFRGDDSSHHQPLLGWSKFQQSPIMAIDCSRQQESIRDGCGVDIRLEFNLNYPLRANTAGYCLIIYDKIMSYTPLTGLVKEL